MAQSGNFLDKFNKDLEFIYAKYSHSFDGSAEFTLDAGHLPQNVKAIESIMFSNREHFEVLPNHDSSSQDLRLANCSYSSDENCYLMSYHRDEESGQVFTTPIGSLDEETTSSSSYDCDNLDGWESDCSGPIEAHSLKASNKGPDLLMETPCEPEKTFLSPSKTTFLNKSPGNDSRNSLCPVDPAFSSNHDNMLTCIPTKRPKGKISYLGNVNAGSQQNYLCEAMCSTLLTAVQEFQNIVSNFLLMSRSNGKRSRDLALPKKCGNYEKYFEESSQSFHSEEEFSSNQQRIKERGNSKSRKSLDFQQPACVFEKLYARRKGSARESFIEVASRQSFNRGREIQSSANENHSGLLSYAPITVSSRSPRNASSALCDTNYISLSSTEALDEWVSSCGIQSPGVKSPGARSPGAQSPSTQLLSTSLRDVQHLPVDDNKPASYGRDLYPVAKRSTTRWHSTTPHNGSPVGNSETNHIVTLLERGRKNSPVHPCTESPMRIRAPGNKMPYENDVISLGTRTAKVTQCSTSHKGCLYSEATNEPKLLPINGSPLFTPCRDKGVISPGVENSGTRRRSVPLRATPGSNNMCFSDISLGLVHQTSTPDKQTLDEKRVEKILPETFFKQKKITQPRQSLLPPGCFAPGDPTPSPIRPSSKRDQSAETDESSACNLETRTRRGPSRVRDHHAGSSRRRLYTRGAGERLPPMGETSVVTQRLFSGVEREIKAPLRVDERKPSPNTTPQGSRLSVGMHFDHLCSSPLSSSEESPRSKSLKMKITPKRKSTGCRHPYKANTVYRKSPSLASPLQALRILSPSSCDESGRWSTIRHSAGKRPVRDEKELVKEPALFTRNFKSCAMRTKNDFEHAEESKMVIRDCSKGNCRKIFCFNCSMDCS